MVRQYSKLKILLTGSNGQLGSSFYKSTKNVFNIIATNNEASSSFYLDITNVQSLKYILSDFNPDVILNCAAFTNVDLSEKEKFNARNINVIGLQNLINYSSKNTKIIQISSDYIYDGSNGPYNEKSKPNPLNYYGKTKLEAENSLIGSNKEYLIFRIGCLFDYENTNNFFYWVYSQLKQNKLIKVTDDQINNPTYAKNLSKVIMECIMLDVTGVYNYGSLKYISRYEFAKVIARYYSFNSKLIFKVKTEQLNQIAIRPKMTGLDCSKLIKVLGIELLTIEQILATMIIE